MLSWTTTSSDTVLPLLLKAFPLVNQEGRANKRFNDLSLQRQSVASNVSASENLLVEHRKRLQDPLRLQRENFERWNQEEFEAAK